MLALVCTLSPGFWGEIFADEGWTLLEPGEPGVASSAAGAGAGVERTPVRGFGVAVGCAVGVGATIVALGWVGRTMTCDVWPSDDTICG
jgi:hypothetical protein